METLKGWAADPVLALAIGLAGIVIGIAVSHFYYRRALKEKVPRYFVDSYYLLDGDLPAPQGLSVQFNGVPLTQVTVSKVCIWNAGRDAIRRADVAAGGLEIIVADGARILAAEVVRMSDIGIAPQISACGAEPEAAMARVAFEYLDQNDALVAEVVHTAGRGNEIHVRGKVIGARAMERMSNWPETRPWWAVSSGLAFLGVTTFVGSVAYLVQTLLSSHHSSFVPLEYQLLLKSFLMISTLAISFYVVSAVLRRLWSSVRPLI